MHFLGIFATTSPTDRLIVVKHPNDPSQFGLGLTIIVSNPVAPQSVNHDSKLSTFYELTLSSY